MAAKKPAKKRIKDLKPSKRTAQKVKGGGVQPPTIDVLGRIRETVQRVRPS